MMSIYLIRSSIFFFAFSLIILVIYPQLDLIFSNFFYNNVEGFKYQDNFLVLFFFELIPIAAKLFILATILHLAYLLIKLRNFKLVIVSLTFYLTLAAILGPGLIVNYFLKENFGRARPAQITYFNGAKEFTRAFYIANQCASNCSFSSGHAAMAYYFTSFSYLLVLAKINKPSQQLADGIAEAGKQSKTTNKNNFIAVYLIGLAFGFLVGLSRIMMGGHFLSDVIASGFITLTINHLLYLCWKKLLSR